MTKQVVILAGGKGTRLKSRLNGLPKPLCMVGDKPLLEHQILLAKRYGFTNILILLGFGAQHIKEFCLDGSKWAVNISYVEEKEPLGSAGAVLNALDKLQDQFILMYGDTMLDIDLARFWQFHEFSPAQISILVHPNNHPYDSDLVEIAPSTKQVKKIYPYPHPEGTYLPNLVNAALYVINKSSLTQYKSSYPNMNIDFGKELFPQMLEDKVNIHGYISREYIKDAGTPDRLDMVTQDYVSGKIAKLNYANQVPTIFLDRDGIINKANGYVRSVDDFHLIPEVAKAIAKINQSNFLAVIITNQPVVARGECSLDELHSIHNKLATELGKDHAYIDALYYCPHHPDKGFPGEVESLKIRCNCRKPSPGMIIEATKDLNIDLNHSWFIGDSNNDIKAARNAKIKSILISNKYSDHSQLSTAGFDFKFMSLNQAIDFILECYKDNNHDN